MAADLMGRPLAVARLPLLFVVVAASLAAAVEVQRQPDGSVIFSQPGVHVVANSASGNIVNFSPDDRWWHLTAIGQGTYLVDQQLRVRPSPVPVAQWSEDGRLLFLDYRRRRLQFIMPGGRAASPWFPLPRDPSRRGYWKLMSPSTGERYLYILFADDNIPRRWLAIVDSRANRVAYFYAFDAKLHQGDALRDTWHEIYQQGEWLYAVLSANAADPDYMHFLFRIDGTGWRKWGLSEPYHRSHVAMAEGGDLLLNGYWKNNPSRPVAAVSNFLTGEEIAFTDANFGHGSMRGDWCFFSEWDGTQKRDVQVTLWNWKTGEKRLIAETETDGVKPVNSFYARARPVISQHAEQLIYHETRNGWAVTRYLRLPSTKNAEETIASPE